jgi:hypothetical protein
MRSVHKSKDPTPRQSFKGFIAEGMAFEVPSWLDEKDTHCVTQCMSTPVHLGAAERKTVPSKGDYPFEEVFQGEFGDTALVDPNGYPKVYTQPIMKEVLELEEAKRAAVDATTKLVTEKDPVLKLTLAGEQVRAEHQVVECRVAAMTRMLTEKHKCLCFTPIIKPKTAQTAFRYTQMEKTGNNDYEIFPVQSSINWASSTLDWTGLVGGMIGGLDTPPNIDDPSPPPTPTQLQTTLLYAIKNIHSSAPRDSSTKTLRRTLNNNLKHPLKFKAQTENNEQGVAAHWDPSEPNVAKKEIVYSAVSRPPPNPLTHNLPAFVTVTLSPLDVNVCDQWHNPCINKYVQENVKETVTYAMETLSRQTGRYTSENPDRFLNTFIVNIMVSQATTVHVFTLSPFYSPDTCTVSSIMLNNDSSGGILRLPANIEQIKADPDMEWNATGCSPFYCIGSRKNTRLNEQELNYVHSCNLQVRNREFLDDPSLLPNPHDLELVSTDPKAKSARISFIDWDILVSSFKLTTQEVRTVITMVQYPPPGARYTPDIPQSDASWVNPKASEFVPGGGQQRHTGQQPAGRTSSWDRPPKEGHMYFIPGLYLQTFTEREWHVYMIDTEPTRTATMTLMREAKIIRDNIWSIYSTVWDTTKPNMWKYNIERNTTKPEGVALSIHSYYVAEWSKVLHTWVTSALAELDSGEDNQTSGYLYCPKGRHIWQNLLNVSQNSDIHMAKADIDRWVEYSDGRYKQDVAERKIKPLLLDSRENGPTRPAQRSYERPARDYEKADREVHSWPSPDEAYNHYGTTYCIPGISDLDKTYWVMMDLNCMIFMIDTSEAQEDGRRCMFHGKKIRRELCDKYFIPFESGEAGYYAGLQKKKAALTEYTNLWRNYIIEQVGRECDTDPLTNQPFFKTKTTGGYFFCHDVNNWKNVFSNVDIDKTVKAWTAYSAARYEKDKGDPHVRVELSDVILKKENPLPVRSARPPPPPPPRPTSPIMPPTTPTPYQDYNLYNKLYYIPGIRSKKDYMDKKYNVYVIDTLGESELSELMIEKAKTIKKELMDEFIGDWEDTEPSLENETLLYTNVERDTPNSNAKIGTTRTEYATRWKKVLQDWIVTKWNPDDNTFDSTDGFLFCSDDDLWEDVCVGMKELSDAWTHHTHQMFSQTSPELDGQRIAQGMIALPPDRVRQPVLARIHTDPETTNTVAQLRERVAALETKLDRSHQDANRDHLMQQLLARMNAM